MDNMDNMDNMNDTDTIMEENQDHNTFDTQQSKLLAALEAHRKAVEEEAVTLAAKHKQAKESSDKEREEVTDDVIDGYGIQPNHNPLSFINDDDDDADAMVPWARSSPPPFNWDLFGSLSQCPEIILEVAKNMDAKSILNLFCICQDFNAVLNGHMKHFVRTCAEHQLPITAKLFTWRLYHPLCKWETIPRPHPQTGAPVYFKVLSLKWLQMLFHREKTVRDILACLARQGLRTPASTNLSLKKAWFVMDIATSARRAQVMNNPHFMTDEDLWNLQHFIVKLDMRFNDPIDGTGADILRKLLLGQRGLTPLCKALKRTAFTSRVETMKASIRYSYNPRPEHRNMPIWDIPPQEIGIGHLEGWGKGRIHLMRIDELVTREATRRALDFKNWIMPMMVWGYIDTVTGANTPATDEEKYMSDDDGLQGGD
ncbi:hypothetical protein PVAG01_04654 [Phlyctema vagabunda]|uniref:F-box domain-containing protein n=1 Tax=Phlyctema vagabunda TaxID=108571 RepID=A0ABR4PHU3_9HELO